MRFSRLSIPFLLSVLALPLFAAGLRFGNPSALYPAPDTPFFLQVSVPSGTGYTIRDITGREAAAGRTTASGEGFSALTATLPRGWYEITFSGGSGHCGIYVSPETADRGEFWCVDAGMTWSGWPEQHRSEVIKALKRRGIHSFRERMSWHAADNGMEFRDGQESALRRSLYDHNALELFQNMPSAFLRQGTPSHFDCRLELLADGARRMEERLGFAWDAVEAWNEPFFFGGNLPADQYVPVAKTLGNAFKSPMVAGCFSPSIPQAYLRQCLESGFAQVLDAFTLHIYSSPEDMSETVEYFRQRLQQAGCGTIPLWVSESGTPGSDRYPGATAIAMRAIESLSLGVERFYAFYLQFHQEGTIRWGMSDESGAPGFALAAYLTAAEIIGEREFTGTIPLGNAVSISRVFCDNDADVLVIYGAKNAAVELPALPVRLTGADGRSLPAARKIVNTDGLCYAIYAPGALKSYTRSDLPNMNFYRMRGGASHRIRPRMIIQLPYPAEQVESHSNNGYLITPEHAADFRAAARIYNFTESAVNGTLRLTLPDGSVKSTVLAIPARGCSEAAFTVDFLKHLEDEGACTLRYDFESAAGNDRITQLFCRPPATIRQQIFFSETEEIDWSRAAQITGTAVKRDLPGEYTVPAEEFSSVAALAWSSRGLHYRVTVRDARHEPADNSGSSWQYDSLQLAVSQFNSTVDHNRFEWGFFLDRNGKPGAATFITSTGKALSEASDFTIVRNEADKTTVYEGVIDWNDLGSMNAIYDRSGLRLKFTFCVNDHNGGKRRWSEWTPGIANEKDPALFAELTLTDKPAIRQCLHLSPDNGLYSGAEQENCQVKNGIIRLVDKAEGTLTFPLDAVSLKDAVTLRFRLAATEWTQHNGTGFSFTASLADSQTGEGFGMHLAPGKMFAGTSGFMILEKNAPAPLIGTAGWAFAPDGKFHTLEFTIDAPGRRMSIAIATPDGKREICASGPIVHNSTRSVDKLIFTTSGWGAGPFLLKEIQILHSGKTQPKKQKKQATMNKKGVYINEDFGVFYHKKNASEMTEETLRKHVELYVKYGGVKAVVFNLNAQRAFFDSKTRTPLWEGAEDGKYSLKDPAGAFPWENSLKRIVKNCRLFHETVADPVKIRREICHEYGAEMWISMRMNDVHWVNEPRSIAHNEFWHTRPDCYRAAYRGITWNSFALDYAKKDVFEYNMALVREYLERFDIDGLELDWMRTPPHVRPGLPDSGRSVLTAFMRQVREIAREAEKRVGHPIRIGVRVPDTPQTALAIGMDVFQWAKEELVDLVVPSPYVMSCSFDMPIQLWKQLLGDKVELVPCIEAQLWNGRNDSFLETDVPAACGFAASYHAMGADNIYLFNYFPSLIEPESRQEEFRRFFAFANDYDKVSRRERRHILTAQENFLYDTGTRHCSRHSAAERELIVPFETGKNTAARKGVIVIGFQPGENEIPRVFCNGRECPIAPAKEFEYEIPRLNPNTPLKMRVWDIPDGILQDGSNMVEAVTVLPVDYLWLELDIAAE